ncbi:hypothetical protein GCM10027030_02410 [Luteococcus sediminum]
MESSPESEHWPTPHSDPVDDPQALGGLEYVPGTPPVVSVETHPLYRVGFAPGQADTGWADEPSRWDKARTYRFFGGDVLKVFRFAREKVPAGYCYAVAIEQHRPHSGGVSLDLLRTGQHD